MSTQIANVPTALTANTFTRTGYTFSGWNTAASGAGTAYANGATYAFAADITLYAQWTHDHQHRDIGGDAIQWYAERRRADRGQHQHRYVRRQCA